MTMRWRERRVEDELLKRELLLRLRAEQSDAPGRSGPPVGYFRRRAYRVLLRHPLFALRYFLLANELDLQGTQRLLSFAWLAHARGACAALLADVRVELWWQRRSMRTRLVRVGRTSLSLALPAGVALAAAAATAVVATHEFGSSGATGAAASAKPQSSRQVAHEFSHAPRAVSAPVAAASARRVTPKRVDRRTSRHPHHARTTSAQRMTLVSNTVQTTTEAAAPPVAASSSAGPAPLPAPPPAPAPSPLKAPHR